MPLPLAPMTQSFDIHRYFHSGEHPSTQTHMHKVKNKPLAIILTANNGIVVILVDITR